ncbi:MAG: PQ-loop domain-containing transporter [Propionibacteriaceae bacterium]|nr:hypothetical protein [Micropruina sp.]HBX82486.1 hypothetical protein [Propionibacteriaceae bacterium]HBY24629.1 hypothetical protein [Propionibacteriaceae bacterium]
MDLVSLIGWLGTLTGVMLGIPQAYRIVTTRDVEGVSLRAWQINVAVNLAWGHHGIKIGALNMIVVNALGILSTLTVLVMLARLTRKPLVMVFGPGLLIALGMIASDWVFGSALYGLIAAIPAVAGLVTQGVELVRADSVEGVSGFYLLATLANFAVWSLWGLLVGDAGTLVASAVSVLAALFNVAWWAVRVSGLGAAVKVAE